MTDPLRTAAQALLDAQDSGTMLDRNIAWAALRRVLSEPHPASLRLDLGDDDGRLHHAAQQSGA